MNNTEYDNLLRQLRKDLVPVGSILAFPSKKVPDGYMPCEGQELSIRLYPELYEVIGHTWGGNKSSFCLPDLQGQFIRGWDREGDVDPEREFGKNQEDSFQGHAHVFNLSDLELSIAGAHDHDLYWVTFEMRDASMFDDNNHNQRIPVPYNIRNDSMYDRVGDSYETKDGTKITGDHTHELINEHDALLVGEPSNSAYGDVAQKIKQETRPKNIALSFCIKVK